MPRRALEIAIPALGRLDRAAGALARQLAQALRAAVDRGDLRPGDRLPATRRLAGALQVSRSTVVEAYEQLVAEGFLEARAGAATRVAPGLAGSGEPPVAAVVAASGRLPGPAEAFGHVARALVPLPAAPFAVSVPVGATLPDDAWRRIGNRVRARGAGAPAGYGDSQGALPLRRAIADYVRRSRAVRADAGQIIVTTGTQQGLYLACKVLLGAGDRAWVEDPAYIGITGILARRGTGDAMVRVPVDEQGLDVPAGIALAPDARAAFVTPSHQYPLGMPLSQGRRRALLAWAGEHGAWVVEDDYDSELRYAGHPFPALQGLAPGSVVYLGTFSKILFPALRLGYLVAPPPLVDAFVGARILMDREPPGADQHALAAYMDEGHLERHIRRIRGVYAESRAHLVRTLARIIPRELAWVQPGDQGMHIVLWLATGLDDRAVAAAALTAGVAVRPLSPMFSPGRARPGLVLGFGGFAPAAVEAAARQLLTAIAGSRPAARPKDREKGSYRPSPR